jgi:hypothetical protein
MSKSKMVAAKQLIQEKKYSEARSILATVDHPTAREWESKLDKLMTRAVDALPQKRQPKSRWDRIKIRVLAVGVLFLVVVFMLMMIDNNRKAANVQALNDSIANQDFNEDRESCLIRSGGDNAAYEKCMRDRGH